MGASWVGEKTVEGSVAAYQKFEEVGGTEVVATAASATAAGALYVGEQAVWAGNAVNESIDANPTLANMKRQTTQTVSDAASWVSGYLWGGGGEEAAEAEE